MVRHPPLPRHLRVRRVKPATPVTFNDYAALGERVSEVLLLGKRDAYGMRFPMGGPDTAVHWHPHDNCDQAMFLLYRLLDMETLIWAGGRSEAKLLLENFGSGTGRAVTFTLRRPQLKLSFDGNVWHASFMIHVEAATLPFAIVHLCNEELANLSSCLDITTDPGWEPRIKQILVRLAEENKPLPRE